MRNEQSSSYPPEEARNAPKEVPLEEAHDTLEEVMVRSVLFRIMEVPDETLDPP